MRPVTVDNDVPVTGPHRSHGGGGAFAYPPQGRHRGGARRLPDGSGKKAREL